MYLFSVRHTGTQAMHPVQQRRYGILSQVSAICSCYEQTMMPFSVQIC